MNHVLFSAARLYRLEVLPQISFKFFIIFSFMKKKVWLEDFVYLQYVAVKSNIVRDVEE